MYTNEINQEERTFHLYNYIYKREKKKKTYIFGFNISLFTKKSSIYQT